nr:uncharacterized protein LOC112937014 [Oryza sativa Japonica Group]
MTVRCSIPISEHRRIRSATFSKIALRETSLNFQSSHSSLRIFIFPLFPSVRRRLRLRLLSFRRHCHLLLPSLPLPILAPPQPPSPPLLSSPPVPATTTPNRHRRLLLPLRRLFLLAILPFLCFHLRLPLATRPHPLLFLLIPNTNTNTSSYLGSIRQWRECLFLSFSKDDCQWKDKRSLELHHYRKSVVTEKPGRLLVHAVQKLESLQGCIPRQMKLLSYHHRFYYALAFLSYYKGTLSFNAVTFAL